MKNTRILESLECPECKADLKLEQSGLKCQSCSKTFPNTGRGVDFELTTAKTSDSLDQIKLGLKSFPKLYNILIDLVSPVFPIYKLWVHSFIREKQHKGIITNIGSGSSRLTEDIVNVDLFPYKEVDLICDITKLPFKANSVEAVISLAVLEHVKDPQGVVLETFRILKPGGQVFCFVPFMQPFHASPYDFTRWTKEGIKVLFKDYKIVSVRASGGPTSGLLWVFQEYLAMILSFGYERLHNIILILLMVLTFPIKFLDILFLKYPTGEKISSGFTIIAEKPQPTE